MTSPTDVGFLVLYASIAGAVWFAFAARKRRCLTPHNTVGTISFFNGILIAGLGTGHLGAPRVYKGAIRGRQNGNPGSMEDDQCGESYSAAS